MFKAGHRRLRQLAQRQKKDPADPETKAEEDRQQLSALQREGLLSASAVKKSHAKKGSVDSTPSDSKSVSHASCKSSSRRDVERIGQPWLADPLERCMADPLMSSGRVASLDLSSYVDNNVVSESEVNEKKQLPFEPLTLPDFIASGRRDSAQQALDGLLEASNNDTGGPSNDADKESKPANPSESNTTQEKTTPDSHSTAKPKPVPKNTLKLFPDPVPPRLSSKTAWRLSKVLPANPPQPRPQRLPTLSETSKSALPSPTAPHAKDRTPKEPRSAPAATSQFNVKKDKASENTDQSSQDKRHSTLPMNAINAFPLPAPTRPLPSLPQSAATADAGRKAPKKKTRGAIRNVSSPVPDSSKPLAEPAGLPDRSANSATPERAQHDPSRAERVPASKVKEMAQHLDVAASETEKRSRSFGVPHSEESKDQEKQNARRSVEVNQWVQREAVPGSPSLPQNAPAHSYAHPSGSPMLLSKHSEPMLAPAFREGSQIHRSNSYREPIRNEKTDNEQRDHNLRSEYPIPSSDEEGIARNPWPSQAQKKRRRAKQHKPVDLNRPAQRVPRIEKPTQPDSDSLSPQNNRSSRSFGRSSPSQYSQCTFHSHESNTFSVLEGRIAQLERQNKILQAALLAALDVGNKDSAESLLSGTVASLLSVRSVSSKTTPASSFDERTESTRRETWLDTSSRRSSVSSNGVDMDFGWLSDKSSVGDSLRVQV